MPKISCSHEEFIKAWFEGKTVHEVAKKTGMQVSGVYRRAHRLREKGVSLPRHGWCSDGDYKALAALAESYKEGK